MIPLHNIICKLVLFRPREDSILCRLSGALREAGGQAPSSALLDTVSQQFRRMVELGNELADMIHYIVAIAALNGLNLNDIILAKDKKAAVKYHHDVNLETFLSQIYRNEQGERP